MKKSFLLIVMISIGSFYSFAQQVVNKSVVSPEIGVQNITFRVPGPQAKEVKVEGSWMGEKDQPVPLSKNQEGVWSVQIPISTPDLYTYNFLIDGVPATDVNNGLAVRDRNRNYSAVILPGKGTENYFEAKQRGTLSQVWYDSPTIGSNRRMFVYTPYGYEKNEGTYPVLYLLHPGGRDEEAWTVMGRACQILDNLIEQKKATPMIVVMPNINPEQQAAQPLLIPESNMNINDPQMADIFPHSIVKDIIPYVESTYRVIPNPDGRAIAGASRGGRYTMVTTSQYPGTFNYICVLSMGLRGDDVDRADENFRKVKVGGYKLYWIGCGTEDALFDTVNVLHEALNRNDISHTYHVSPGAHTWSVWRNYLNMIAPLLFK